MADPVSLAVTVALTAAQMGLTALQQFEGPRLTDTKGTVADYGTALNYVHGRRRIACPAFFAEPIRERKKKRKGKGGKQTSYTGFGTFAVHLCDHPIAQVRKVWFDQHLVYDNTGSGEEIFPLADDYELASFMRIYTGAADQEPDPRMLATVEALKGPGTCPAFLDTSYLFFEDIPLEQIGNRFPQVRAEIDANVSEGTAGVTLDFKNGVYTVNGVSKTLEEVIVGEAWGDTYTPADVVPGVGMRKTVTAPADAELGDPGTASHANLLLSPEAFAAVGTDGFTVVMEVRLDGPGGGTGAAHVNLSYLEDIPPDWGGSWGASIIWAGPGYSTTYGTWEETLSDYREPIDESVTGAIPHRAAATLSVDDHAMSVNGEASVAGSAPPLFAMTPAALAIGVYATATFGVTTTTTLERMDIRPPISSSQLAALSGTALSGSGGGSSGSVPTLGEICADVASRCGLDAGDVDFTALDQEVPGYSWTQGTGRQVIEPLLTLFDSQLRPHDFLLEGIKQGGAPGAAIADSGFAAADDPGQHYTLGQPGETDLPRMLQLTFADTDAEQQPNTVLSPRSRRAVASVREQAIDMSTVSLDPQLARDLLDRVMRRKWFAQTTAEFALPRRELGIEPGDVHPVTFAGTEINLRCEKLTFEAGGPLAGEWMQDDPALAALGGSAGAPAAGHVPSEIFDPVATTGAVLDLPLLADADDQSAPFAYLAAAPAVDGTWPGADFAVSDTAELDSYTEGWGAVASSQAAVFGTVTGALGDCDPFVFDDGSSLVVEIESGVLAGATLDTLLTTPARNLALIGDELVQFRTATLTAPLTYTLSGFLRGQRGTEAAAAGHASGERFVLLEGAALVRTLGAAEIGDTDHYIATTTGRTPDQDTAEPLAFTAQAHRPYSPVHGQAVRSGNDWLITATRRTRIGGAALNGQDVPLGEASEAWEADVMDGVTVKRTLTGTSLPLTYTEAQQITDWGGVQTSLEAVLHQMNPTLSLRGAPLNITG